MAFAIDQLARMDQDPGGRFAGRLDLESIGVFGHSLGGATAAQFCHDDPRCKAGADLDGALYGNGKVIQEGLRQPFLFILSDHGEASDPVGRQILGNIQQAFRHCPPGQGFLMTIHGANHFSLATRCFSRARTSSICWPASE